MFEYEPFPSSDPSLLRVLRVSAGEHGSPLRCSLEFADCFSTAETDNNAEPSRYPRMEYEALSYCWGDPTRRATITLNDCEHDISANLYVALENIRLSDTERVLWVDALCINQNDMEEKSKEVTRMVDIYYNAKQAIIWIGNETANSTVAMDFVNEVHQLFRHVNMAMGMSSGDGEFQFDWLSDNDKMSVMARFITPEMGDTWKSLHRLLSRPWFGRAWTVQEISVCRRAVVTCGAKSVPWEAVELAIEIAGATYQAVHNLLNQEEKEDERDRYRWPSYYNDCTAGMVMMRSSLRWADSRERPEIVSHDTRGTHERAGGASMRLTANIKRGCFLPHDKIYSVLGLLPTEVREAVVPTYSDPPLQVFKTVTKACIEKTGWLNIICHSTFSKWHPEGHPSWVPDWTRPPRSTILAERNRTMMLPHDPVKSMTARVSFSEDLLTLTAEGFVIAKVETPKVEKCGFMPDLVKINEHALLPRYEARLVRDATYPPYPEFQYIMNPEDPNATLESDPIFWDFPQDFYRLMTKALPNLHVMADPIEVFLEGMEMVLEELRNTSPPSYTSIPVDESKFAEYEAFYVKIRGHLQSRTLFLTEEGKFGIGPDWIQENDLVCLLFGCDSPVVLRKREDGTHQYVGEAFVRGVMGGECIQELEEGKYNVTKLTIT
jgi:hypothetical protein